jgi:hypothetical protein
MAGEEPALRYLKSAIAVADDLPAIPNEPLMVVDLENLAECAATAAEQYRQRGGAPVTFSRHQLRLLHVAEHDVPRLLREVWRARNPL